MNKDELIDFIAKSVNMTKEDATKALDVTTEAIASNLPFSEKILYSGEIFELYEKTSRYNKDGEIQYKRFEYARRSPGVRGIIVKEDKILLTKEYRYELEDWDYRLPGGKVYDSLEDYRMALKEETILSDVQDAIKRELLEEVGIKISSPYLYYISKAGATVIWDLYYFIIDGFEFAKEGQDLGDGENISYQWFSYTEIKDLIKKDLIKEDRSIGIISKYIMQEDTDN